MPLVTFQHDDGTRVSGEVPRGTSLLNASFHVGALIRTTCGGFARCTDCRVHVVEKSAVTEPTEKERRALGEDALAVTPLRLACQACVIDAPVTVSVLPRPVD